MAPGAGVTPPPVLAASLARFAIGRFRPGRSGPVCEILTTAQLDGRELIYGLVAGSAADSIADVRCFANATGIALDLEGISEPLLAVWARAHTVGEARTQGVRPVTSEPPDLVTNQADFHTA